MDAQVVLALLTGVVAGGIFAALEVPIPAPPNVAGVVGIVGLYLGFKGVESLGYSVDLLALARGLF
ncbi:XapX domain-containing protein [Salinigranum sp. GCM10025319]|uniref:XapX domain-containing protein n=1 Tax=Salinigranum sp. GCM10025319 TaxID=3252687 RepID=UPI0036067207